MQAQQIYKTVFLGEIDAITITLDFFLCLHNYSQWFFFPSSRILPLLFLFVPRACDMSLYNDLIIILLQLSSEIYYLCIFKITVTLL